MEPEVITFANSQTNEAADNGADSNATVVATDVEVNAAAMDTPPPPPSSLPPTSPNMQRASDNKNKAPGKSPGAASRASRTSILSDKMQQKLKLLQSPLHKPKTRPKQHWILSKDDMGVIFGCIREDVELIGRPQALYYKFRAAAAQGTLKLPPHADEDVFAQRWSLLRKLMAEAANSYAETLEDNNGNWADGSDAFELALNEVPQLSKFRKKFGEKHVRDAWWVAHHCWVHVYRRQQQKVKKLDNEERLLAADRHLDEGVGNKRGKITRSDRAELHKRLKAEGKVAKESKLSLEKKYKRFAKEKEQKRKEIIAERKKKKASIRQGDRAGSSSEGEDFDSLGSSSSVDDEDAPNSARSLSFRSAANRKMKQDRAVTPKSVLSRSFAVSSSAVKEQEARIHNLENKLDSMMALLQQHLNNNK